MQCCASCLAKLSVVLNGIYKEVSYINAPLSSISMLSLFTLAPNATVANIPVASPTVNTGNCSFKLAFTVLNENSLDNFSELFKIVTNSINDINFGAGTGEKIENHFYLTKDGYKRFFDEDDLRYFFKDFNIEYLKEDNMNRYGSVKRTYEVVLNKNL